MGFIITLAYFLLFFILVKNHRFFKIEGVRNEALLFAFVLKVVAGFALYLVYSYYYSDRATADVFKYFDDGKVMANALFSKPVDFFKMLFGIQNDTPYFTENYYNHMNNWFRVYDSNLFSDSHLIIRYNALVMVFSFGCYHVHTLFSCFLSFVGLTAMYKFFIEYAPKAKFGLFLSIYLIPSVVFWGSGVLKEGLIFFSIGMLLYHSNHFFERYSFSKILIICLSILILLYTKIYVLIILFPLMIIFKSMKHETQGYDNVGIMFGGVVVATAFIGYLSLTLLTHYDVLAMLAQKQHDFFNLAQSQHAGSLIYLPPLTSEWSSYFMGLPTAFANVCFRPLIGLDNSPLMIPSALENLILWSLSICAVLFPAKQSRSQKLLNHFSIWFVLGIFVLTGLTTPILGAIVRYKTIALPFWGVILSLCIDKRKLYGTSKRFAKISLMVERKILYKSIIR
jgi:hypothetical protein